MKMGKERFMNPFDTPDEPFNEDQEKIENQKEVLKCCSCQNKSDKNEAKDIMIVSDKSKD